MHGPGHLGRRALLAIPAASVLQGCSAPMAAMSGTGTSPAALALLDQSAAAHGSAALAAIADISVSYAGQWRALVGTLQPDLVDSGFRGRSEERVLLRDRVIGQSYTGPEGHKQVVRRWTTGTPGEVRVWFNGVPTPDQDKRAAAALVADGYSLFLLGPMLLAGQWAAERSLTADLAGSERLMQDGRSYDCTVVRLRMAPGLGFSAADQLAVYIDSGERLMRRVRFSLDGLESTRGAVAEVDTMDHVLVQGVRWPTRFHERLLRPLPLPVHDWRMTGLDLNRGLSAADVDGASFSAKAAVPATAFGTAA